MAPPGTEDTQQYYNVENSSFAWTYYDCANYITLQNGTRIDFTDHPRHDSIELIDWRNLIHCKYLNLGWTCELQALDISFLKSLRALNIWKTRIRTIDLTPLEFLDTVVCGSIYVRGMQVVTVR